MRAAGLLAWFLCCLAAWPAAWAASPGHTTQTTGSDAPAPLLRNRFLEAELGLARGKGFYLVFELERGEAQLKARGVAFRSWPVRSHRLWGGGIPVAALPVEERTSLFTPERETLQIPEPETGEGGEEKKPPPVSPPDLQALEVTDMPSRYALRLPGEVTVAVAPGAQGLGARAAGLVLAAARGVAMPLRALWSRFRGRPFATLDLVLDEADARALYWAVPEGTPTLFWFPTAGAPRP